MLRTKSLARALTLMTISAEPTIFRDLSTLIR